MLKLLKCFCVMAFRRSIIHWCNTCKKSESHIIKCNLTSMDHATALISDYHRVTPFICSLIPVYLSFFSPSFLNMFFLTGWILSSSKSTQTWTSPAPSCLSRTSRYIVGAAMCSAYFLCLLSIFSFSQQMTPPNVFHLYFLTVVAF